MTSTEFCLQGPTGWIMKHSKFSIDTIYIKTQVFRLLKYYSPAPKYIARSDWATQKNHTQHDIINKTALWGSFTLIMLHSREREF